MNKAIVWLLFLFLLFSSCQSISRDRTELNIPLRVVYFSFDDGPNACDDTTVRLLEVLGKYQIRAMFCLLGENAEQYPGLVRRIYDNGHYIINHGYADKHASKMNEDEFRDNLIRGELAISSALGFDVNPKLYRPHGGFYSSHQEKICSDEGYTIVPVNVRVYDAIETAADRRKIARRVIKKVEKQGGGMVLLHDARGSHSSQKAKLEKNPSGAFNRSWIPETVEEIITILLDRGFILNDQNIISAAGTVPISDL